MRWILGLFTAIAFLTGCANEAMSEEEQIALKFVEEYQNNTDIEVRKKFVEEHVHHYAKKDLNAIAELPPVEVINYAKVAGVVEDEKKNRMVLITGKDRFDQPAEEIFIFLDGKITWPITEVSGREIYQDLRKQFK